jgi:hypothetical protein
VILSTLALYLLLRYARKAKPSLETSVLPVILESLALVLLVIWRACAATMSSNRL